jgi:transposase
LLVLKEAENMLENSQDIWKSQQIVDQIQSSQNVEIKNDFACKILRHQLGLGYRQVKMIAYAGNNVRNLSLRCLYAQALLK